jgi:UDP-glucose 4-epimerase
MRGKPTRHRVAVIGATGFIGRAVAEELRTRGSTVVPVTAPRLAAAGTTLEALERSVPADVVAALFAAIDGSTHVVNAAGLATATSGRGFELVLGGANAVLPLSLARACREAGARLVHLSSAAVQGRRDLDESSRHDPLTTYAASKAAAEVLLTRCDGLDLRILRPTSVHGPDRGVSRSVARLARSPWSVLPRGPARPTPQVHVRSVADAVIGLLDGDAPMVSLQPSEGFDTSEFLTLMGAGRKPAKVPRMVCRLAHSALDTLPGSVAMAYARRLELLWWGQRQSASSLDGRVQIVSRTTWQDLARALTEAP